MGINYNFVAILCLACTINTEALIGASMINQNEAPYHLMLSVNGSTVCGATLLTARWLVTAAQCVRGIQASWVTVTTLDWTVSTRSVDQLIPHPDFNFYTLENDVAVLRVASEYNATQQYPRPLQVVPENFDFAPGTLAFVSGYGPGDAWSPIRGANATLISHEACELLYHQVGLTESSVCAQIDGEVSLQIGDAGGALEAKGLAVGVASFTLYRRPAVFTRLAAPRVRQFILTHTGV